MERGGGGVWERKRGGGRGGGRGRGKGAATGFGSEKRESVESVPTDGGIRAQQRQRRFVQARPPSAGSLARVFWGLSGGKKGGFTSDSSNTPLGRRIIPTKP